MKLKAFRKYFLIFIIGCIVGWAYEMLFYRIDMGEFIKRGQGVGPWLPIYGFGAVTISFLSRRLKKNPVLVFAISVMGTAAIEFCTGWVLYTFAGGLRLWDYNTEIWNWGNIGGYVCLRSVAVFGIMGMGLVYIIQPALEKLIEKSNPKYINIISILLACAFATDFISGYILRPLSRIL